MLVTPRDVAPLPDPPEPELGLGLPLPLAAEVGEGAPATEGVPEVGPAVAIAPTPPVVKPVKVT